MPLPSLFPLPGASIDLWFEQNAYYDGGIVADATGCIACSRASNGFVTNLDGTLTLFSSNVLRIGNRGLLSEIAKTNVVLWNQDLTNAVWTKTNITAVLDQTGPDGVANSASSITASAANATVLQSITLGSSVRFQSAWIKRLTGSGTINMTMDNGTTWTAVTVTSSWTLVTIPTQTLANPIVGFRIVTNGDAIAVDFVQNEDKDFVTSPIPTTTASVTRAMDYDTAIGNLLTILLGTSLSIVSDVIVPLAANLNRNVRIIGATNNNSDNIQGLGQSDTVWSCYNGSTFPSATLGSGLVSTGVKGANGLTPGSSRVLVANGGTVFSDADVGSTTSIGPTPVINGGWDDGVSQYIQPCGYMRRLTVWNSQIANVTLQDYSNPASSVYQSTTVLFAQACM